MAIHTAVLERPRARVLAFSFRLAMGVALGVVSGLLVVALAATQIFGYHVATIQSFSMQPALDRGDLILSRPVSISEVEIGDIVLFEEGRNAKILVAHRVSNIVELNTTIHNDKTGEETTSITTLLATKGDANQLIDADTVSEQNLKGEVWLTVPTIGFLFNGVPLQMVLLGISIASLALWGGYEALGFRRRRAQGAGQS